MGESRSNESGPPAAGRAWLTRRGFLTGVVGSGAVAGLARATEGSLWHQDAFAATAPSGPPTTTLPLPTTTAPEQLLLTWGADPATSVTVSWSAPGTVAQPAPTLAYSTSPITAGHPGRVVTLPRPAPLDVTRRYGPAASVSFTDGLNEPDDVLLPRAADRPAAWHPVSLSGERRGGTAHDGTTTLPATPFETFVFGRGIARGHHPGHRGARALEGSRAG
jgi:hypothetical protein